MNEKSECVRRKPRFYVWVPWMAMSVLPVVLAGELIDLASVRHQGAVYGGVAACVMTTLFLWFVAGNRVEEEKHERNAAEYEWRKNHETDS